MPERTEYKAPDISAEEKNVKFHSVTSTQGPGEGMQLTASSTPGKPYPCILIVCYLYMQSFPVWAKVCPSLEAPPLANRCCYACDCNTSQSQDGSPPLQVECFKGKEHPRNAARARPALAQDFWFCFPPLTWREKADAHRNSEPWGQSFTRAQVAQWDDAASW